MDKNINKEFGYLTIKERVDDYITPKGLHMKRYLCRCNKCGKIKEITYNNLLHGQKSCGCSRKHPHKYNQYDLSGKYGIGYTSNTNKQFYFDLEDYNKIKDYCWMEHKGYICSKSNNQFIAIHQLILGTNNQKEIDHLCSENKFDNRKCNLRFVTHMDNMCNRKAPSNNQSGIKGVYWDKTNQRWIANITRNNKRISKSFKNKQNAIKYRKHLENELQHKYSYDNSQKQYRKEC